MTGVVPDTYRRLSLAVERMFRAGTTHTSLQISTGVLWPMRCYLLYMCSASLFCQFL
jgi:hypothetical protein